MLKSINLFLAVSLSLLIASCSTDSTTDLAEPVVTEASYVTMPKHTAIVVTLTDSIDTDVQTTGHEFRGRLSRAVVVNSHTLFADGAEVKGTLNKVIESGHLKTPAELNFSLTAIQDGNGRWIDVGTDMIMEKKGSHTNREVP